MLQLNDISIGYRDHVVATHLSAHLNRGALTCLIGRNGTGKSTLMRTIAAFQPPLSGSITITMPTPTDVRSLSPRQRAQTIGIVLTERNADCAMSVREVVAMGRMPYTGFWGKLSCEDNRIVDHALESIGMSAFVNKHINALSDGERQKVMIAKALAQDTPLIILDEPTAFLDYPSKIETMEMLRRLCRENGKTILLSTHDLDVALRLTDHTWHMENGTLNAK